MGEDFAAQPLHTSYLGSATTTAPPRRGEAVVRGMVSATLVALVGIVLVVVVWRSGFEYPVGAAVMSGGAVFAYARSARRVPRRGLLALLVLLLGCTLVSFYALFASDGWVAYTELSREMPVPMSRAEFIRSAAGTPWMLEGYRDQLLQVMAFSLGGALAGLVWVHRAAR